MLASVKRGRPFGLGVAVGDCRQAAQHHRAKVGGAFCHTQTAAAQGIHLRLRGVIRTANDGTRVTHAASRRSSAPRDERHYWLVLHVGLNPTASFHLIGAADFANHDDAVRVLIGGEHFQDVDEVQTLDRIATDAHAGGLADAAFTGLPDRLIGERSGATDDANGLAGSSVEPVRVNVARHDADLAATFVAPGGAGLAPRGDDTRAVWTDEDGFGVSSKARAHADHVLHRDAFGDGHNGLDASVGCFKDGVGGKWGRNKDHRGGSAGRSNRLSNGVENGQPVGILLTALAWGGSANHARSVLKAALGVEGAGCASDSLADDRSVTVNEDRHRCFRGLWMRGANDRRGRARIAEPDTIVDDEHRAKARNS